MGRNDTVLVVDDDEDFAATLVEVLRSDGHRLAVATSGGQALTVLGREPVALLLLDLDLPDMNGFDVMRVARRLPDPPEVLVVTGTGTPEAALRAVEAGTTGVILKPVDFERLAGITRRIMERRRLAADNAHLQVELSRRLRESDALLAVASTISSTLDVREALRRISRELARVAGADATGAYLLEEESGRLVAQAGYHVPPELIPTFLAEPLLLSEQGFYLPIWADRQPVHSDDVANDARFSHTLFRRFPHQSGLLLPLVLDGHVAGAFYLVWWTERVSPSARVLTLLQTVGAQVEVLLKNARLFEQADRERSRLQVLYDVGRRLGSTHDRGRTLRLIIDEAMRVLAADAAGIRLVEGDELVVVDRSESAAEIMGRPRIEIGEGVSGRVVATGAPVSIADLTEEPGLDPLGQRAAGELGFRSCLGVPLRAHGRAIGALTLFCKGRRHFASDAISLLSALADQASVAIEKASLDAEIRDREAEASKLYEVTGKLASSLETDPVLDVVVANARDLLGCDASGIYTYHEADGTLRFLRGLNLDERLVSRLRLRPGEGIAGRAYTERRPVWTADRLADASLHYTPAAGEVVEELAPRAYLAVPIVSRGRVHGVLVDYYFEPHEFTARETQLLSTLADHAAVALDNSRLFSEISAQRRQLGHIFASTSDGMMLVSRAGRIEAANRKAGELLGFGGEDLVGLEIGAVARHQRSPSEYDDLVATIESLRDHPERGEEGDLHFKRENRVVHWVALPTGGDAGDDAGFTVTLHDVTREREVSEMKSDFVSFVTHQLRTPLTGIRWMLDLAAQQAELPTDAASFIQDAGASAERLIGLVNNLLDVSRLERGKITIDVKGVELGALTQSVLEDLAVLVAEKGHRLAVEGKAGAPTVVADPQLLRQVILNLVSNAIKYTPSGGDVRIRMGRAGEEARWEVQDSGIGIPAVARPRLFEKFYRASNVSTVETEGTGLGLYLVRLILEQHGGRVWCDSEEGRGSTFGFALPLERAAL
jgi:PAS domain S-box-containing protein